jgi:hypothetical protein
MQISDGCVVKVTSFGDLRQGWLRSLPLLSFLSATLWIVGNMGRSTVVVGFRWPFCEGGVLSTACVFVGSLLGELRLDTVAVQLWSDYS